VARRFISHERVSCLVGMDARVARKAVLIVHTKIASDRISLQRTIRKENKESVKWYQNMGDLRVLVVPYVYADMIIIVV